MARASINRVTSRKPSSMSCLEPTPPGILQFGTGHRFAKRHAPITEKKPGVEAAGGMRWGDRPADIDQPIDRRDETACAIRRFDRGPSRPILHRLFGWLADKHADFFPGLADRCARRMREPGREALGAALDAPWLSIGHIDRTTRKDIDAGHKSRRQRPPPDEDFEIVAFTAQQNQRGGIAWPHRARPLLLGRAELASQCVVHRRIMRDIASKRSRQMPLAGVAAGALDRRNPSSERLAQFVKPIMLRRRTLDDRIANFNSFG